MRGYFLSIKNKGLYIISYSANHLKIFFPEILFQEIHTNLFYSFFYEQVNFDIIN